MAPATRSNYGADILGLPNFAIHRGSAKLTACLPHWLLCQLVALWHPLIMNMNRGGDDQVQLLRVTAKKWVRHSNVLYGPQLFQSPTHLAP